ncbi:sulfite exporter TauE/SafE family protein [Aurantivibrio infirmus]
MDIALYILAGAAVGLAVGLTGVGGGSLMTPLLILFGFPYNVAIGTDLLYAAITKSSGVISHHRHKSINWRLVSLLGAGSIPASLITIFVLNLGFVNADEYKPVLTSALGVMLILTSLVLFFRPYLQKSQMESESAQPSWIKRHSSPVMFASGVFLGVFVTLSSVGAGALCAALLLMLFPRLTPQQVVGTDIAHAVPLTLIAGLGHLLLLNNVDLRLLGCLLIGSLPAIHLGTKLGANIPKNILHPVLATILLGIGAKFAFF